MRRPAVSLGEFIVFCLVVFAFWGTALVLLSIQPACADSTTEDENMMRDFGLLPETPLDLTPTSIEYSGAPVPIVVGVGTERRLVFEHPFRIGIEPAVSGFFDLEIYGKNLLIRANRAVSTRARVQLSSGTTVPLDIQAVAGAGPAGPLEIAVAMPPAETVDEEEPVVPATALPRPAPSPGYVDLVRHAAQLLYAPPRLQSDRPGLRNVPVTRDPVRLVRGVRVESTPIASWEEGGLVITAVRITNLEKRPVRLDPRQIVGHWRAASFHHGRLRPRRDHGPLLGLRPHLRVRPRHLSGHCRRFRARSPFRIIRRSQ